MRSWILGGLLAAVTTSGITFVIAGAGNPNHCGPCDSCRPILDPMPEDPLSADSDAGEPKDAPRRLPQMVSYDEPPLANPQLRPVGGILPATYLEPAGTELAPMPRTASGELALATPNDPY